MRPFLRLVGCVMDRIKNILGDGGVEFGFDLLEIACLSHDPHQLGQSRLGGHIVGLKNFYGALEVAADVIDGQVTALVGYLRRHNDDLACLCATADALVKVGILG